jgi:polyisoprenoid-binding protein YceI
MSAQWQFDMQHSGISFTVRHMLVSKVRGRFTRWSGALQFQPENPALSSVEVSIDTASVDTAEAQRDGHLRSGDFLDVEKFPSIVFKSTKVEKKGDAEFLVTGDLTIRGVSRPVLLEVEYGGAMRDPWGNERAGFTAKTTIDRKEFGISFNQVLDHGGLALGEKITIDIDIEATRAVAQAAQSATT